MSGSPSKQSKEQPERNAGVGPENKAGAPTETNPLTFYIITLFPEFFTGPLEASLFGRALKNGFIRVELVHLRDFAMNRYGQVDDAPYGGGSGMVLMAEPIKRALDHIRNRGANPYTVLLSPRGYLWNQERCRQSLQKLAARGDRSLALICGHYEGVDERVASFIDESVCIGDYVLSGGEPAAMILMDSMARLLPGFMGNAQSIEEESFQEEGYLEYPQFTRPETFEGIQVPEILLSGHHARIEEWRREQAKEAYEKFRKGAKKTDLK